MAGATFDFGLSHTSGERPKYPARPRYPRNPAAAISASDRAAAVGVNPPTACPPPPCAAAGRHRAPRGIHSRIPPGPSPRRRTDLRQAAPQGAQGGLLAPVPCGTWHQPPALCRWAGARGINPPGPAPPHRGQPGTAVGPTCPAPPATRSRPRRFPLSSGPVWQRRQRSDRRNRHRRRG